MLEGSIRIGIDVGGTFTDLVAIDGNGTTVIAKTPSTPADQSIGVLNGLDELARSTGLSRDDLLSRTERIVHGTTVATNALLERKGADVVLMTSEGHRDILEMREGLKQDRYNLRSTPPEMIVPRDRRLAVSERMGPDGSVLTPLALDQVDVAIEFMKDRGTVSVAICFLHSYKNAAHEVAAAQRISDSIPGIIVSASHDVLPQIKEYDRFSTTLVNAYVAPQVRKYLNSLVNRLREASFRANLFIIFSHGGVGPVEEATRLAAGTALSGPAGGVAAAVRIAQELAIGDIVPFDMGGTSTDISLVSGSRPALSSERELAGQRIALRSLDIASIGAGGGSIARVGAGGTLSVGPESAGAVPGPACYGQGGREPTVTDANLILGFLDPGGLLGGSRKLDRYAAETAVAGLAEKLGLSLVEAAAGIYRVINLKMADGIRLMTVRRGVDPRRFALLSFGGAAGLHAVEVARQLDMKRVIVPTFASVLSAWGMLASDLRYEVTRTHIADHNALTDETLRATFDDLEADVSRRMTSWFDGAIRCERSGEMRYGEQIFEIEVPLDGLDWHSPGLMDRLNQRFHDRHLELYTYASPQEEAVLVNARVSAIGSVPRFPIQCRPHSSQCQGEDNNRPVYLEGWRDVPVLRLDQLSPGDKIIGPALVDAETTTVVIGDGDRASINPFGWLDIVLR